uniref:Uncharacterized protein n=1 Tax=Plectus sambesii TaxID=2011161 RepID=A0A914VE15_9BILA
MMNEVPDLRDKRVTVSANEGNDDGDLNIDPYSVSDGQTEGDEREFVETDDETEVDASTDASLSAQPANKKRKRDEQKTEFGKTATGLLYATGLGITRRITQDSRTTHRLWLIPRAVITNAPIPNHQSILDCTATCEAGRAGPHVRCTPITAGDLSGVAHDAIAGQLVKSVQHWRYIAPQMEQVPSNVVISKMTLLLNTEAKELAAKAKAIDCPPVDLAETSQIASFVQMFARKCQVFHRGLEESGDEPFLDLSKYAGIGIAANSLSCRRVQRGPNYYGQVLENVRIALNKSDHVRSQTHLSTNPRVHLFGDATAFAVTQEFTRETDGIAHMWLTGEPTCDQLIDLMQRTVFKQSTVCICILLGRYELKMAASVRQDQYQQFVQQLQARSTTPTIVVAPLPYPGLEMAAVTAAAQLRCLCSTTNITLLEPTEQFMKGKSARSSLFIDVHSPSLKGIRLLAVYLQERGGMPLPSVVRRGKRQ